ncbi:acetyl-CoA synthetase-like protein [Lentinus brumalis]|uniref:Acetyl-CoA synthetase-like protein n=1 Tax=Lentinus brumalis TaxID=2498619 RepID=A0A371DJF5_9APHY|nr:acetyl-CoA synthetase-like protein [Polyporus brumalis]
MADVHADGGPLLHVPDDLTIEQFILCGQHPVKPRWYDQRPVLIDEETGREVGSDELRARTHGLANALKSRWNIGRLSCIFSPNHIGTILAVQKLGGIVSTANPAYTAEELVYQLRLIRARILIVHPWVLPVALEAARTYGITPDRIILFDPVAGSSFDNIQDLVKLGLGQVQQFTPLRLSPGDAKKKLALLSFSSGTTGKPKAVMITHYSIIANLVQIVQYLDLNNESVPIERKMYRPGSVSLAIVPFYHAYGMHMLLFGNMVLKSTIVVSAKFSLERMLRSIQQYRVTHLCIVPPQVLLLCKSPMVKNYDLSSVYFLMSGAAPLSAELQEQLVRTFPNCIIGQGYAGMTEIATGVTHIPHDRKVATPGSAGVLLPGFIARVVKPDGSLAGYNERGELHLNTPSRSLGYLNNPAATAETYYDGWIRTGDEVILTARKELFIIDRIKELLKVRGFQVAPSELEGHLLDHPDVADVCVVGVPDEFSGELPFAFVVLAQGAQARVQGDPHERSRSKEMLLKHVADHKTAYKRLAGIEFVDAIPKNPSGKLLRRVLRERARAMVARGQLDVLRSKL